jgi:hypothetical protein
MAIMSTSELIAALRGTTRRLDAENTYLREQIAKWIDDNRTSPSTRAAMADALRAIDELDVPLPWPGVAALDVDCATHGAQRASGDDCAVCAHLREVTA